MSTGETVRGRNTGEYVRGNGFKAELSMGWVDPRVVLGWVGSGLVEIFAVFDWLGWVEYDRSPIFLMTAQHTIAYQLSCSAVVAKWVSVAEVESMELNR